MNKLLITLLIILMSSCGGLHLYTPAGECASQVGTYHDIREAYFWTDNACEVWEEEFGYDSGELLGSYEQITMHSVPKKEQIDQCGQGTIACATSDGTIWVRQKRRYCTSSIRHEVLHLLMWKAGIDDPDVHHQIMRDYGWY